MPDPIRRDPSIALADLAPAPGSSPAGLDAARRALAIAHLTGQTGHFLERPFAGASPEADDGTTQALDALIRELGTTDHPTQRVVRRDFPTPISPDPRIGAVPGGGQAPQSTLGPFQDSLGRPILINVFDVPTRIGIQRAGAAQPFMFVELPPPTGSGSSLMLGAGSVWISAAALATGVPADSWVGLRITSGTVSFGTTVTQGTHPIVVSTNANISLTLTLDPATAHTGSGPGADARAAIATVPEQVVLTFAATASLSATANAKLTAFGTSVALSSQPQPAHFDPVFGRVDFPFSPAGGTFSVAQSNSTLATFNGQAAIFGAAWSLPISLGDPASLGAAAGAGGLAIGLTAGLNVLWSGRDGAADCGPCVLLVEPGLLAVGGFTASAHGAGQVINLQNRNTFRLTNTEAFAFRYTAAAAGIESWAFLSQLVAQFDQPRTVNNDRVRLAGPALMVLLQTQTSTMLFTEAIAPRTDQAAVQSYCLKNLLLKASNPLTLVAVAFLSGNQAGRVALALQFSLRFTLPILPDPYATNLLFNPRMATDTGVVGVMSTLLRWGKGEAPRLDLVLPAGALGAVVPAPSTRATTAAADAELLARMQAQFDRSAGGSVRGPTLLDVSTNISQFGVLMSTSTPGAVVSTATPSVADLYLQSPGTHVRVVALPAVQWEPVTTPDQTLPFDSPLSYAHSGPTLQLGANSVTLVPVAPREALDALLAAYNTAHSEVAASFTLPFGIAAVATLQRSQQPFIGSPGLTQVQPTFGAANLRGGDQISLQAAHPRVLPTSGALASPSLAGSALQLHNARVGGVPTTTTALTPIDDTFTSNFGPAAANPRVPLTRIDLSGFGESVFSDWRNPVDASAIISKARFDVVVGRTSREVVQAYGPLYPYAARVVHTIIIERQNGGKITRRDNWETVRDGRYLYPTPELITHPGVILGAVSITNIRDTGQRFTTSDGSELMAVRFDCALVVENVVRGAGPNGVPAYDQLGFVQISLPPPGQFQLAPDQYAEALGALGPLGGLIDCTIDVAGTGLLKRLVYVNVAASPGMGGPEFVMTAWGSLVLPGGGQWTFLRQGASEEAPVNVDPQQGVPLVRAGPAPNAPPPSSPYRFADPADLLHPDTPAADYALLHATGTQRLLFPRPKVEATGPHAFTSTREPMLADPFALATATGPFPRLAACIPFPDANYSLAIGAGGNLVLQPSPFTYTAPILKRVLRQSNTVRCIAYTADENNKASAVTLTIDTAAPLAWSINVTNLSLATESGSFGEVTRIVGDVQASASQATQLANSRLVFGEPLKPVAELVSFLEQFGSTPPPAVSMTNDWGWQLLTGVTFDLGKYLSMLGPGVKDFVKKFIEDLDVKMQQKSTATTSTFVMQFEVTFKIPTPFTPIVAIALGKVQFEMGDDANAWTVQVGCGIGVSFSIGFEIDAYYAQSAFLITGDTVFGLGASSLVKGTVDLKVVEAGLSFEAKIALIKVHCVNNGAPDSTIWGAAQVTIALEVSIFFVIDIEFDVQAEWTNNFDGGSCVLPDVL